MSYSDKPLMDIPPRNQIAVWWKVKGKDLYGQSSYESPVEIKCRWDDVMEEFVDTGGNRQMSKAKVFPDREISVGDVLWLGRQTLLDDLNVPENNYGYSEVRMTKFIHNFDQDQVLYIVVL